MRRLQLLLLLLLSGAAWGQAPEWRGVTSKTSFLIPDRGYQYTLEDPDDRSRLRGLFHARTIRFANSFVASLKGGAFRNELERVAQIGAGGANAEKLHAFLEGLEVVDDGAVAGGMLPPAEEAKLKRIRLAWSLVQMVRYGAPGFRSTFETPGDPGGFEEFLERAQLDREFLARVKEFEDRYEKFIEVSKDGVVPGVSTLTQDQILDAMYASLKDIFDQKGDLAPGTRPPDGLLRDFARAIVEKHLTSPDDVWRIQPSWYDFAGTTGEVRQRTQQNFMSSGFQILAWSLPRVDFGDPEAAVAEMGKAYQIDFKFEGWTRPGGPGADFPGNWGMSGATELRYSTDPTGWTTGPGPEVSIFEAVKVETSPIPMKILDQSLARTGLTPNPDELSIEELVRAYWKELEAYDNPPGNLGGMGSSLSTPAPPASVLPTGRFSGGTGGGSFP